jgi:hypothetical protein
MQFIHKQFKNIFRGTLENTYLGFFKLIKLYEIDTDIVHYAPRNALTYKVGSRDNVRRYAIDKTKMINNTLLYVSGCAEPLSLSLDLEKTTYYIDSKQFDTIYTNKLIKQMYASNQINDIKYILYIVAGHALFTVAVHFGYIQ